jgi:hypothetical protein
MNTNRHESKRKNLKSQIVISSSGFLQPSRVILIPLWREKNLSRSKRPKKATGIRWVTPPQSSLPGAPAVQGVALAPNEDVQWFWTHTLTGSYVSGFNIVRRLTPAAVILSPPWREKNLSRTQRPKKRQRPFAPLRVTNRETGG